MGEKNEKNVSFIGTETKARRDHEIWRISQNGSAGSKMDLLKIINSLRQAGQYLFESRIDAEAYSIKLAYAIAINLKVIGE